MVVAKAFTSLLNKREISDIELIADVNLKFIDHPIACRLALDKSYVDVITKTSNPLTHLFYDDNLKLGAVTPYSLGNGYNLDPLIYQMPLKSPKNDDVFFIMPNNSIKKYNMEINWDEHFSNFKSEKIIKMYSFIKSDYTLKSILLDKSFENVLYKGALIKDYIKLEAELLELGYVIIDKNKICEILFNQKLLE